MNRTLLDLWVGVFVAAGIAATVFIALRVASPTSFSHGGTYSITADFDNIGGLKVRAPVKSSGVVVGRVSDIRLDNEKHVAEITLELEDRYQFTTDTSASIFTSGLLGEQYVSLEQGAEEESLKNGGKIILTSSALVLESLISEFMLKKASE